MRSNYTKEAGRNQNDVPGELFNQLGRVLYKVGRYGEAEKVFEQGLLVDQASLLKYNLMAALLAQGKNAQAKRLFFQIPHGDQRVLSFLYKSYFSDDDWTREKYLSNLGSVLVQQRTNFCEWLYRIKANYDLSVIYPDISNFEEQLRNAYALAVGESVRQIDTVVETTGKCASEKQGDNLN